MPSGFLAGGVPQRRASDACSVRRNRLKIRGLLVRNLGRRGGGTRSCHFDCRRAGCVLQFRVDGDFFRRLDTKSDAISADLQNRYLDVVGDDDLLIAFPTDDKHTSPYHWRHARTGKNTSHTKCEPASENPRGFRRSASSEKRDLLFYVLFCKNSVRLCRSGTNAVGTTG